MSPEEKIRIVMAVLLSGITVELFTCRFKFFTKGMHVPNMCEHYAIPEIGIYMLRRSTTCKRSGFFEFDKVQKFPFTMNDFLNAISELDDAFIADRSRWALTGEAAYLNPPSEFDPEKDKYLQPEPSKEVL